MKPRKLIAQLLCLLLFFSTACTGLQKTVTDNADKEETEITFSKDSVKIIGDGATAVDTSVTITSGGVYRISGYCDNALISILAEREDAVTLSLNNANLTSQGGPVISEQEAKKLILSIPADTVNVLSDSSTYDDTSSDVPAATVSCVDNLTIMGTGTLTVNGNYAHALKTKDKLSIQEVHLCVNAKKDAIHSNDSIVIESGSLEISADDDAIHANDALTINAGKINILKSYEGLEASNIEINGGDILLVSEDDGLNAAGGNDSNKTSNFKAQNPFEGDDSFSITINGGMLSVDAGGDGIDSNGFLIINGGDISISGPTDNGNGIIDYGTYATITGGCLKASGSSGMLQGFTTDNTQPFISYALNKTYEKGTTVTLFDNDTLLTDFIMQKSSGAVIISLPELKDQNTYQLKVGDDTYKVIAATTGQANSMQPPEGFKPGKDFKPGEDFQPGEDFKPGKDFQPGKGSTPDEGSTLNEKSSSNG